MKQVSFLRAAALPSLIWLVIVAVLSWFVPVWVGLALVIAFLVWQLSNHYRELHHFALWLTHPTSKNVPSGHGVWTDIFAKLYAMRRMDEKHEAQLAEWLERFQNTMRHLPDGVVLMDKSSHLEWCNPVAEQHFEFSLARDRGHRMLNLVREPKLIEYIRAAQYDAPMKMSYLSRQLEVTLIEFEEESVILVSRDITETERVDAMRRDFIANASHELRTPLTVISGFLEYAQDPDAMANTPVEEQQRQMKLMHRQAEHMTILVSDMLMLSRLESEMRVEDVDIDMPRLLEQQLIAAQALSNGQHEFMADVVQVKLRGSHQEIDSVITNLLSNAVRYTPAGGVISLKWSVTQEGAVLSVSDTGVGIAPEHLPRLTERFYRVNKDQSRASKGTGLGLAIVKHVLIRHQAELKIHSNVGEGSTFIVQFPKERLLK
ncbi:phosphate regulon sensor histidine kinase PhoR [Hydromonas duriensis]|uniref:Phosphate regulon sensor protein PhoR n=1 Tax=Hydromonas duriensis TaxID=1527608 RepID=A0A4R6YB75_9BURK|nr:phosphate regulon sensor histidine kinase PhoR [Hydromonas duriensis]TDR32775.1 two-component system phosphate regulon sensor histidine kinase PhoR [Hydromonas duriensis]